MTAEAFSASAPSSWPTCRRPSATSRWRT